MVTPDGSNLCSLRVFFEQNRFLTTSELAILAERSMETVRLWRRRCGLPNKAKPNFGPCVLPIRQEVEFVGRDGLDDPVWLRQKYEAEHCGLGIIARMCGCGRKQVLARLRLFNIPTRPFADVVGSRHPCCTRDWLDQHYVVEGLTLRECAELAGVNPYTIIRWLAKFGIPTRTVGEAVYGRRKSA